MAREMRVTLLGMERLPFFMPLSELFHVPSQATISLLNMPRPPLSPGASRDLWRPTLRLREGGGGTSTMRGVLAPPRETSTTIGPGLRGARVLGARLLLRARDGATDMVLGLFLRALFLDAELLRLRLLAEVAEESDST